MSLRVRVTAVTVVLTAVALGAGGWGLLRSIESTELGRLASVMEARLEEISEQVAAGELPDLAAGELGLQTQVIDNRTGDVLRSTTPSGEPLVPVDDSAAPGRLRIEDDGGTLRVSRPLPGVDAGSTEVRYEAVATPRGVYTVVVASPLREVTRALDAVRRTLGIGVPMVVALVGLVAWLVTGRALRPVEAMRAEVEAITHSTLHRRVPEPAGDDEVGRLARTMNAMLDRLESSAESQRRFVADASHELRTPVATLRAQLEVAERSGAPDDLRHGVSSALAEEARIEALLADLLLLARIEEAEVRAEEVDLGALVRDEVARPRPVPVTVVLDAPSPVRGSALQLGRVVANLLDNAARHAATEVAVRVEGRTLTVDDDGPGVPEPERERVFERFHRLDEGRARDAGGAGLGLAIVRAIVRGHGGEVAVTRSPTLGGARFTVELPAPG